MARVVVTAYVTCYPVGGFVSWVLQWVLGLHRQGCDVFFVEKAGSWPKPCVDLRTLQNSDDCTHGVALFRDLLSRHGLGDRYCFVDGQGEYFGLSRPEIEEVFSTTDVLLDMGGSPFLDLADTWMDEARNVPLRVLIDSEPGYTQIKMAQRAASGAPLHDYNRFYSVGLNLSTGRSSAPLLGHEWKGIVDPVLPDLFPVLASSASAPYTTVMNWESHATVTYEGITYGQKNIEFEKFMHLPKLTSAALEVAATGERLPADRLKAVGWRVRDSYSISSSFDDFRTYIAQSRGEFAVCKNVFVATNSGFFSDRSAVYLASGRPVIMQDTGFSAHLPCGEGLFAVKSPEEAAEAIAVVEGDYARHSAAARAIALEFLDTRVVFKRLLEELGV